MKTEVSCIYLDGFLLSFAVSDGRAFHTFTKGFKRPYDEIFHNTMNNTMKYLCEHIQGCKLGYTQSDEITLLLTDYDTITTDAWFGYGMQKVCSVAASMATLAFNKFLAHEYEKEINHWVADCEHISEDDEYMHAIYEKTVDGAMFDARCFSIPKDEVTNCFLWRFLDCERNSVQMLGQTYFSHKELHGLSCNQIQEKLFQEHGINWAKYPEEFKNGVCAKRAEDGHWVLMPMVDPRKDRKFFEECFNFENM